LPAAVSHATTHDALTEKQQEIFLQS